MDMLCSMTRRRLPSSHPSAPANVEPSACTRPEYWQIAIFLFFLGTAEVGAQYSVPGTAAPTDGIPSKELLEESIESARWNAGPWKLGPWIGIQDASFVQFDDNQRAAQGQPEDDYTITVGAGLRGYLKTGRLYFATHALPEYVWWQEDEERRQLNGRYGAGLFGYLNRATFELSARRSETQRFFSSEIQELTSTREDILRGALEVELGSRISLLARGTVTELENEDEDIQDDRFSRLDHEEESLLLGVRYRTSRGLSLSLSFEDLSYDFAAAARDLSSSGEVARLEAALDGNRISYRAALASYSLDPEPASVFRGFDDATGLLEVATSLANGAGLFVYARRSLAFSAQEETSHYLSDRYGASLTFGRQRFTVNLFGELGEDDFEPILGNNLDRLDDVQSFGAGLDFQLSRLISLRFSATLTDYDSNVDFFDRDVTSIGFSLELGALFEKLQVGERPGIW